MNAAVLKKPLHLELQDLPTPEPSSGEVLLQVKRAGICGSDIHFYDGASPIECPQILGHEMAGVVAGAGAGVTRWKEGDRVVVEPAISCGKCYPCRSGKYNCCDNIDMIGVLRPGGFAEYLTVPQSGLYRMPEGMSFDTGALCEPFSIGAQIVHRADPPAGTTVCVMGMGPIGLTVLSFLREQTDCRIIGVDLIPERLSLAKEFGAEIVINPKDDDLQQSLHDLTHGEGAPVVIECVGSPRTISQSVDLVSSGGRVVIAGVTFKNVSFPGRTLTKKEIEIFGSRNNAGRYPTVLDFLEKQPELVRRYISRHMPLTDIGPAFEKAIKEPATVNKIILDIA